ncbi:MAG TPA: hypothetical protein PL045_03755, partial [Chitinophagaceae bacterium]|nr:hypothetical protein [Chitinophagaceae bacterium]
MRNTFPTALAACCFLFFLSAHAQKKPAVKKTDSTDWLNTSMLSGLQFRSIGPAVTSGRIADLAVTPQNMSEYYVASASGGVWKTTNAGITFNPIFDGEGSYSIGCLALDPSNSNVLWVGSGENNNQRSVAYGDGIYKSEDGGKSFSNMGLKNSEHIGRIAIDPTNGDVVYVAAYGPLWSDGGERGIYKTMDGGKTWRRVLYVSEYTGCNEVLIDPSHPNIIYAAAHQRQRKVFTYIGGGPESALYKSVDSGHTWNKIMSGMPGGDIGRIGLALSPVNTDVLYAIVEAQEGSGIYKSTDRGASWEKQSGYSTSGNYYQEIFCDPKDVNKIFCINMMMAVSTDGGKTVNNLGEKSKHVDNHVIWVEPSNTQHMLVGCDGGLYESFDGGENWNFKSNLPVTQFYKVTTDNAFPFYNVHGGTQDNFSLGGPSRTTSGNGIVNSDWYVTSTGDGFESQVDHQDPNIIYAQSQYGGLVRFDKKSGEYLDIRPVESKEEPAFRWNWDAPLLISKFDNKRLYFAANKVFRTDDRGNTWKEISPDLSRQLDRNKLTVMGKVWSVDAVAKNQSTDVYGNITTLAESKFDENLLYAGTDDGLIHVTQDGGKTWTKIDNIAGVPERTYVNEIITSQHDRNTVYVTFNHHRYGDFHPYIYRSTDAGKTWTAIQNNLPERGTAYCIAEDYINKDLLFAGTEFGLYFTIDGGKKWYQLKGGLPTIAVRDMEIQQRENDLVLATFGRGFYVLDNYAPLRNISKENFDKAAFVFPMKDAWMYLPSYPMGIRGKAFQGESYFNTPNPKVGAVITYYLKDEIKTIKQKRKDAEAEKIKNNQPPYYPSIDSLRMEDEQPDPYLLITITDDAGNVVRRIKNGAGKGLKRITWDFRYAPFGPVALSTPDENNPFGANEVGYMALPGTYKVSISKFENGVITQLTDAVSFKAVALNAASLPATDKKALDDFSKQVAELRRITAAADEYRNTLNEKINYMKAAISAAPQLSTDFTNSVLEIEKRLNKVNTALNGDATLASREFETSPSINGRVGSIVYGLWSTTAAPTQTMMDSYNAAKQMFTPVYNEIK